MEKSKSHNVEVSEYVANIDSKQWSQAYFSDYSKSDILLNNLCEFFNATVVNARDKPIITLLEMVRCYIIKMIESKQIVFKSLTILLGPSFLNFLRRTYINHVAALLNMLLTSHFKSKAFIDGHECIVDLRGKKCECNHWRLCGVLCLC